MTQLNDGADMAADIATVAQADIGVIGLAVMGENLILNMASKGFTVAAYNRTLSKVTAFTGGRASGQTIVGAGSLEEFVRLLKRPRKVMLMVKAGAAVDEFIALVKPLLEPGNMVNNTYNVKEQTL